MAHYEEVNVHGYDEFCRAVSERKGKDIFAYFSGDKDKQGKSWCPDCVKGNLRNLINLEILRNLQPQLLFSLFCRDFFGLKDFDI